MAGATDLERLVVSFEARFAQFDKDVKRVGTLFDKGAAGIEKRQTVLNSRLQKGGVQMGSFLRGPLTGIAAALSVREIVQYGDAWTVAGNKIAAAGTDLKTVPRVLAELADLAVDTRTKLEPTVTLFARLDRSTQGLGKSQRDLQRYTETINKSFVVGGAAASEQASGILQLTQAIASGAAQGDELRAIRENAPLIAKGIADVMGVTIGELKQLGADGKITVDVILKALDRIAPSVDKSFSTMSLTVGQALDNLETRFTQFVGRLSENGSFAVVAGGIDAIADNLDLLTNAAIIAAAAFGPAGLAGAALLAARGVEALTFAIARNPIGAVAAVIAAATAAVYLYASSERAAAAHVKKLNEAHERSLELERQVKEGRVELTAATIKNDIATQESERAEKSRRLELLKVQALELEILRQRQKGANPQTGMEVKLHLGAIDTLQAEIKAVEEDLARNRANLPKTLGYEAGAVTVKAPAAKKDKSAFATAQRSIERQTAAMAAQAGVADRTTFELKKTEAATKLLSAAQESGRKVTPALTAEIDRLATAYGNAAAKNEFQKALRKSDDALTAYRQEAEAIGLTAVQVDALRLKQELLNAATKAYGSVSAAQEVQIAAAAESYERQAQAIADVAEKNENLIAVQDDLRQGLVDVGTAALHGADSFGDAIGQMLVHLSEMIVQLYVLKPLVESLFGEQGTTGGGLLGGLISGIGTYLGGAGSGSGGGSGGGMTPAFADGGVMTRSGPRALKRFANGGVSGRAAIFGEEGIEAAVPLPDGRRIPVEMRMPALPDVRRSEQGSAIAIQIVNNAPVKVEQKTSRDGNGRDLVQFIISEVKNNMSQGGFDAVQRSRFGIAPKRVLR